MQKWSLRIHADVISEHRGVLSSITGTREIEVVLNIVLLYGDFIFSPQLFLPIFIIVPWQDYLHPLLKVNTDEMPWITRPVT